MARSHARLLTSIWGDKDFKELTRDAQLAYFMLLSQPDLGHSGLLSITVRRWAGLSADGTKESVWEAITELAGEGFLVVDEDTEELLIRSLVRNDGAWKQPKVLAVALAEAARISSPLLRARFAKEMARIDVSSLPEKTKGDVEALLKALPDALTKAHLEVEEQRPHPPADPPPHPPVDDPSNAPAEGDAEGDRGTRARAHRPQSPAPAPSPAVPPPAGADAPRADLVLVGEIVDVEPIDAEATAQTILGEYIERCVKRPPDRVIGQLGKEIKKLLDEAITAYDVRRGVALWMTKGLHPSTLASVVNEVMNGGPHQKAAGADRRQQATDDQFARAMARAAAREEAG